jgi:hypothetical protein
MKLAPAIEEFVRYKQALGNSYTTPARALKVFLGQTGNVDFDELSAHHVEAFLLGHSGRVTSVWFHRYYVLGCFFRFATSRGYMQHRILPSTIPEKPPRFVPQQLFNSRYAALAGSSRFALLADLPHVAGHHAHTAPRALRYRTAPG